MRDDLRAFKGIFLGCLLGVILLGMATGLYFLTGYAVKELNQIEAKSATRQIISPLPTITDQELREIRQGIVAGAGDDTPYKGQQ